MGTPQRRDGRREETLVSLERPKGDGRTFQSSGSDRPFICDFVSRSAKLVIEVDGGQHGWNADADLARTGFIESRGFQVIRFWNNDVIERIDGVVAQIEAILLLDGPSREREGNL